MRHIRYMSVYHSHVRWVASFVVSFTLFSVSVYQVANMSVGRGHNKGVWNRRSQHESVYTGRGRNIYRMNEWVSFWWTLLRDEPKWTTPTIGYYHVTFTIFHCERVLATWSIWMCENKPMDVWAVDMIDEGTSDANADRTGKRGEHTIKRSFQVQKQDESTAGCSSIALSNAYSQPEWVSKRCWQIRGGAQWQQTFLGPGVNQIQKKMLASVGK